MGGDGRETGGAGRLDQQAGLAQQQARGLEDGVVVDAQNLVEAFLSCATAEAMGR